MKHFVRALGLSLLVAASACGADAAETSEGGGQAASMKTMMVAGTMPFPLCGQSGGIPRAADAASVAWFAGNVYTHLAVLAPALEASGFGKPGDARAWITDFETMKATRAAGRIEAASVLEQQLIGEPHLDRDIEFMSTGAIVGGEDGVNFEKGSTQATWAKLGGQNVVVVAFRGTETGEMPDLRTNLDAFKTGAPTGGEVHRGMSRALDQLAPRIFERIRNEPPGTRLVLTGHSLGGALAVLFATRLLTSMPDVQVDAIYTFGAPRIGTERFVDGFWSITRERKIATLFVERDRDIVTRLPPTDWAYRNMQPYASLDSEGLEIEGKRESGRSVNAHAITGYADLLKAAVQAKKVVPGGRFASVPTDELVSCAASR